MDINIKLREILAPAYDPCFSFSGPCKEMRWDPENGYVPRGFFGATGSIEEIELILIFAEPGAPHHNESHTSIESAYKKAMNSFSEGTDLFHRNVRYILDLCWPKMSFEQQMRKTWMTESVLCSAPVESGPIKSICARYCACNYLLPQLKLLNGCVVAALGAKARDRIRAMGITSFIPAIAAAPPGCNRKDAHESWEKIAKAVHSRNKD